MRAAYELHQDDSAKVVLFGAPSDHHSSYAKGCAGAPTAIWNALFSERSTRRSESGRHLFQDDSILRWPGLELSDWSTLEGSLHDALSRCRRRGISPLVLGGDHAISEACLSGLSSAGERPFTVVHLDAHHDLHEVFDGDPNSHAGVFHRVASRGLCKRLVQVGIRVTSPEERTTLERFGGELLSMAEFSRGARPKLEPEEAFYLSVDLDVLDPAFAPGVSHPEPGGMNSRELIELIQSMPGRLIGADLVELNPERDIHQLSANLAAKLTKELAIRLLRDHPQQA